MRILAIETSCDETALALVDARGDLTATKFKILKNLVASQIAVHRPFGGIVPNLAKREHLKNLPVLFAQLFDVEHFDSPVLDNNKKIEKQMERIDLIAVTVGPGLEPALWTGISFAKELAAKYKKPLLGISHLDGHLYSILLNQKNIKLFFPAVGLIVSGGHTSLVLMKDLLQYKKLGETLDDAVGEAFDKVARMLELPYPGGPEIEKLALTGECSINFPRPMIGQKNYNFSYSGLKTSVLYHLRDNIVKGSLSRHRISAIKANVAASFQKAAFEVAVRKTLRAAEEFGVKSIMVSGGVAASRALAEEFKHQVRKAENKKIKILITKYPTDNAAMIAAAAYVNFLRGKKRKLEANGNLGL